MKHMLIALTLAFATSARADWRPDAAAEAVPKLDLKLPDVSPLRVANVILLVGSYVPIALDCLQSATSISPPGAKHYERDMAVVHLFGRHPTPAQFAALGLGAAVVETVAWSLLPDRYRWLVPLAVGLAEGFVVAGNADKGLSLPF